MTNSDRDEHAAEGTVSAERHSNAPRSAGFDAPLGRAGAALFAALAATPLASALDAGFAAAHGDAGFGALWLAEVGVMLPLALVVAVLVFVLGYLMAPRAPLDRRALVKTWARSSAASAQMIALTLTLTAALVVMSRLGLRQLLTDSESKTSAAGFGVGLIAAGAWLVSLVVLVNRLVSGWSWVGRVSLARVTAGCLVFLLSVSMLGVMLGDTSGQGNAFQLFGVLGREELDLRAPAVLSVWTGLALAVALLTLVKPWLVVAAVVLSLAFGAGSAVRLLEEPSTALSVEQQAPLGKNLLAVLRKLSDRDRDGSSAWYGGGDCDDANPAISPSADDLPDNGIDEDCTGSDARPMTTIGDQASGREQAADAPAEAALPENLGVVLISVDTLRFDLGYMGASRAISPNIDQLAARSVAYENFYALASYTGKSIGPMLIGKYPSETHRGWSHFNVYPKEDLFIQERLQKSGVRTLSVQGHWYFDEKTGLGRGFDVLDMRAAPRVPQAEGDRTVNSEKLSNAAIELLSDPANTNAPFFAWVHYLDPHAAYVRHEKHDFGSDERALYDSEVAHTDEHVGRLLDFISKSDLGARTAILFTSDHGEAFAEHGVIRHGRELWEELVRVPFLLNVPGIEPRRVKTRRSAIDLVPTIAELFGLEVPKAAFTGRSLIAEARAEQEPLARPVLIDMPAGPHNADRQATIHEGYKIITANGRPLGLFNLERDPGENQNLMKDKELLERQLSAHKALRRELEIVKVRPQ